jgi:lipopolysaccharide/colanic/teichoic acid biosynthesis glycosyltransferase
MRSAGRSLQRSPTLPDDFMAGDIERRAIVGQTGHHAAIGEECTVTGGGDAADRADSVSVVRRRAGKRLFDLVVASVCLLLLSPLLLAVALAVRLTTPGPALFRQTRLGRHGRPFVLYKFRTMNAGCPDDIHREYVRKLLVEDRPPAGGSHGLYKLETDPRVTRLGLLLRRTSIDELPQLLNVVRGEMSLVGPRPALPWEAELFRAADHRRFLVMPGLTGLWQVSGRNRLTMREGLLLDLEYVQKQSFALDLMILLKTVPAVLSSDGAL